jgi:hypothetical protein
LVRFLTIRYAEESFVLPGSFGIARLGHILPAQHQPVSFALHCDDLAVESFIEETKPILSRLRRGYLLHAYNVQERLAGSQGERPSVWARDSRKLRESKAKSRY